MILNYSKILNASCFSYSYQMDKTNAKTRTAYLAQYSSEPIIDPNTGLNRNQAIPI